MKTNRQVYTIHHSTSEYDPEPKFLGIYSTRVLADEAVSRFLEREGFSNYPEGFHIDEYELDKDYWEAGFTSGGN